ncbi:DUF456 domain-containing protein [bacterium]|jgi:hypothetical protein|nr:DUF456 domain-containing protein [bacterium]
MEILFIGLGVVLILMGLAGAFLPVLPGLPFSYAALLVLHFSGIAQFSTFFLVAWAIVVLTILILENALPAYTTKKFGGTVYGVTGSTIGMILGMLFFPPLGFFLGTLIGAFVGEMIYKQDVKTALKSAWGSFIGFLTGTAIKVTVAAMIAFSFFKAIL